MASNGYILVRLGHQDESAMLIKEDGSLIENTPQNEFYSKRLSEINGREINRVQDVILNSNNEFELKKAYEKLVELTPLHAKSVQLWESDTNEVLNILKKLNHESVLLKGAFDFEKIGIFGHSVGGATSGQLAANSKEIKAGINIDGFQFGDLVYSDLKTPFMFISSNERDDTYLRVTPFAHKSKQDTYHLVINGFSHSSFSDLLLFSPNGLNGIKLQRKCILQFFDKYLKNENVDLNKLKEEFPSVTVRKY